MNTKQLANHIISLLLQHTIAVTWKDGTSGRARNALKWTRITHATMQRCLQSYMDAAQRKRYRPSPRASRLLVSKFEQED